MKIQNKTITAQELSDMEEEVIFLDPLMGWLYIHIIYYFRI